MKKRIKNSLLLIGLILLMNACGGEKEKIFTGTTDFAGLSEVTLLDGPFKDAMIGTDEYLRSLDPDRLLHFFRLNAGLDTLKTHYGGWEERELRGHSIGHYLSACAMMYLSAGDTVLKNKAEYIVSALDECQQATGSGYLSAFPEEFIDRVENNEEVWAPYYTLHKIMAGLYDCYHYLGNEQALAVLKKKADWLDDRTSNISYEHMQDILDHTEQGGMNEVLYNLYSVSGDDRYLELGNRFYQESYFRPVLSYYDSLKGLHVNSYIPNVVGLMRKYELTGDDESYRISRWFWNQVTEARSYVTGGTSNGEHWNTDPYHMHEELGPSSHETCCTYNMLKLTRQLFKDKPQAHYMDYYERALWNGILPTQDTLTNMTMYYVPMQSGYYKTFGTPENSFWCCTGSGMENFAGIGDDIYAYGNNRLYVNLYIASELRIDEHDFVLTQETSFPEDENISLTVRPGSAADFSLCLRIPAWAGHDYQVSVNGAKTDARAAPGSYLVIDRIWKKGDKIELKLPMALHVNTLPATHEYSSLLYGPVVMAASLADTALTEDRVYGRYGPYMDEPQEYIPQVQVPENKETVKAFNNNGSMSFKAGTTDGDSIEFIPFYKLFNTRYMIYFKTSD